MKRLSYPILAVLSVFVFTSSMMVAKRVSAFDDDTISMAPRKACEDPKKDGDKWICDDTDACKRKYNGRGVCKYFDSRESTVEAANSSVLDEGAGGIASPSATSTPIMMADTRGCFCVDNNSVATPTPEAEDSPIVYPSPSSTPIYQVPSPTPSPTATPMSPVRFRTR